MRRLFAAFLIALAAPAVAAGAGFTIAGEPFAQADVLDARAISDGAGGAMLLITFVPKGAAHLKALTAAREGQPLPVTVDGKVLATPTVHGPIEDGQLQLSGDFGSFDAAAALAKRISGKDPLPETGD